MVVFINFDDEVEDPHGDLRPDPAGYALLGPPSCANDSLGRRRVTGKKAAAVEEDQPVVERHNPNVNVVSEALGCYPSALTYALTLFPVIVH